MGRSRVALCGIGIKFVTLVYANQQPAAAKGTRADDVPDVVVELVVGQGVD